LHARVCHVLFYENPDAIPIAAGHAHARTARQREEGGGPDPAAARLATHPILTAPR
jgi:hypothetical protein